MPPSPDTAQGMHSQHVHALGYMSSWIIPVTGCVPGALPHAHPLVSPFGKSSSHAPSQVGRRREEAGESLTKIRSGRVSEHLPDQPVAWSAQNMGSACLLWDLCSPA